MGVLLKSARCVYGTVYYHFANQSQPTVGLHRSVMVMVPVSMGQTDPTVQQNTNDDTLNLFNAHTESTIIGVYSIMTHACRPASPQSLYCYYAIVNGLHLYRCRYLACCRPSDASFSSKSVYMLSKSFWCKETEQIQILLSFYLRQLC